jgi:hypothetical protein
MIANRSRLTCAAALAAALFFAPAARAQTNAATTNGSATIITGNTFQTVLGAIANNTPRRSLTIENSNTSDSCWLYVGSGSATKALSMLLLPGGSYVRYYPYVPSDAIQATCATSNDTLYLDTQ